MWERGGLSCFVIGDSQASNLMESFTGLLGVLVDMDARMEKCMLNERGGCGLEVTTKMSCGIRSSSSTPLAERLSSSNPSSAQAVAESFNVSNRPDIKVANTLSILRLQDGIAKLTTGIREQESAPAMPCNIRWVGCDSSLSLCAQSGLGEP